MWPVASIRVGQRLRHDLGDLDELMTSIQMFGLLQPILISKDGVLICGLRRYAAIVRLGWKNVTVWVQPKISTELEIALAEVHENVSRKPFNPIEAAQLYDELLPIFREDAARRQLASRFGFEAKNPGIGGPAKVAAPRGDSRALAAYAITGTRSDLTLERVLHIHRLATDVTAPVSVRETAAREYHAMAQDHAVKPHFLAVKAAQTTYDLEQLAADVARLTPVKKASTKQRPRSHSLAPMGAAAAREEVRAIGEEQRRRDESGVRQPPHRVTRYSKRAFLMILQETDYWWLRFDAEEVAAALTAKQWEQFDDWVTQAVAFRERAQQAAHASPNDTTTN